MLYPATLVRLTGKLQLRLTLVNVVDCDIRFIAGEGEVAVVTLTVLLTKDRLPEPSFALTVIVYAVLGVRPFAVNVVLVG